MKTCGAIALLCLTLGAIGHAQVPSAPATPSAAQPAPPPEPKDGLGRATPRGTLRGFMAAARKGDNALATQYLDTRLRGEDAETLAHQLFFVLDARLPARLSELSDTPEGSQANPLRPDEELVGTVDGVNGPVEIRLVRNRAPVRIWLFSRATLDQVPPLFEDITRTRSDIISEAAITAPQSVLNSVVNSAMPIGSVFTLASWARTRAKMNSFQVVTKA